MWWELLCGLVIYKFVKRFFCGGNDDVLDIPSSSDANALFSVAKRLEKLYGGAKAFVGLQIPDPDSASRQNIDLVLLLDGAAMVISVKNEVSGFVTIDKDGTWVCTGSHKHQTVRIPDPVAEARRQITYLESYLQHRGLDLPPGYISCKVICPNPTLQNTVNQGSFPSEVITHEQFAELKSATKNSLSNWIKGFRSGKKDMQESLSEKLSLILSTAPMWDRLQLKGDKYILGEFLEFKGKQDDVQELRNIRRSKVGRLIVQKTSMFGLAPSKLQIMYSPQDYRGDGAASSDWNEVTVRSSTEIIFQARHSTKVRKYKLSSVISMTLSP